MDAKMQEQLDQATLKKALLDLDETVENNARRVAEKAVRSRVNAERQAGFRSARASREALSNRCTHRQGGAMNNPYAAKAPNPSALGVMKMPDGWTKRIFCIVCHGEWFTPHPYLMRKDPFKAGFHMPGGIILERDETAVEVRRRVAKYNADVEKFEELLEAAKDKQTPEAAMEMDCGTTHTLTNSETGVVVYPWRPCDANALAASQQAAA